MNRMHLSESLWPERTHEPIWGTTVGGLLREVAARDPSAAALVEVDVEGESGATLDLRRAAGRQRASGPCARHALLAGRAGRGLGAEYPRMGADRP